MVSRWAAAILTLSVLAACDDAAVPTAPDTTDLAPVESARRGGDDGRMLIHLASAAGFRNADGKAKYRNRGGEQQLEIELEDGPRRTAVKFLVNGRVVASGRTNGIGDASIRLNSDEGDRVPAVRPGTSVAVKTASGRTIVSGSF